MDLGPLEEIYEVDGEPAPEEQSFEIPEEVEQQELETVPAETPA